jgi:electron transport complex protein RnfC
MPIQEAVKSDPPPPTAPQFLPDIIPIEMPTRLWVPLGTGSGDATAKPPGTTVRRGESVIEKAAESSHIPLAPASGTLGNERPIRLTSGRPASAVELIVGPDTAPDLPNPGDFWEDSLSLVHWLERIRAAGVWADRHASPNLIGQLNQIVARPIDTLICTILDTDATLRLNAAMAAQNADAVALGVSVLAQITGARRSVIAVEMLGDPRWVTPIRRAAGAANLEIVEVPNQYPQSDPTLMIYTLTSRRLRPGNLPTTVAVMLLDAAAALAVGKCALGYSMLTVPIAVHDHSRRISRICEAPVGATVLHVLENLGIPAEEINVRGGDLLRDLRLRPDAVIAGGELVLHITGPEAPVVPEHCIRSAWCLEACPTQVQPGFILDAIQRDDPKMAQRAGIAACIECGLCSHVCPSRLPLLQAIREFRGSKLD